ncbi:MAG TPA: fused MFS/spermidine synthase [Mycobacteriales bacterium]|jgi:spermidine synthase|nr:fused MFS/spermidine synthase [Mycobacteriales bacterium]
MTAELIRDLDRPAGWWLLVDGSEQSYVDVDDPSHLEFEYLQMAAHVIDTTWPGETPLDALHLGGGLCTLPRWLAARRPGSRQLVAERSATIAAMARKLGRIDGTELLQIDAAELVAQRPGDSADLVVCDVYEGPDTVTSLFTIAALAELRRVLRADGCYVCNLSDAAPFALAKVVIATVEAVIGPVVMLAEPPVLRGRRSGNLVIAAGAQPAGHDDLVRRAASGPVRVRVVSGEGLAGFVGGAEPATDESQLPASGESLGLRWT